MKAAAPLQKVRAIPTALNTTGKATQNPLQATTSSQNPLQLKKVNKTGLPDGLKNGIENLSGYSMDDVKVHYNSDKPSQLQAHAYAQGTDIHIAPGQEKHLPHEAWHVIQQKQGRVRPTMQMKSKIEVNDDTILEKEADRMGTKAMAVMPQSEHNSPVIFSSIRHNNISFSVGNNAPLKPDTSVTPGVVQLWRKVKGQDGEFEGNPSYHHLHRVGGDEHYRYGNDHRIFYIKNGKINYNTLERAIEACEEEREIESGKEECLAYLRNLLAGRPATISPVITRPEPPKPKKDGPPKKRTGGKKPNIKLKEGGSELDAFF